MKTFPALCLFVLTIIISCKKSNDNNPAPPPPPPPGGALTITSTSPAYTFWGDELTINGSGFSSKASDNIVYIKGNKQCSSDTTWQKAEVINAATTKLVVKVPYFTKPNGVLCGNDWGRVRVTVNNKSVTLDSASRFVGPPVVSLCHPFGVTINSAPPGTIRTGDSSVMSVHLYTLYAKESGYYDKVKLYVNGTLLNAVDRYWPGATCGGLTFVLNPAVYADVNNCDTPSNYNYGPARKMTFVVKIDGTDWADTTETWVLNHPKTVITSKDGPENVSKSAGGNPYVTIEGKYFYYADIEWTSSQPTFHTAPPAHDLNSTELPVYIPLSLMQANNTYTAWGVTTCGTKTQLFSIGVSP
jgi:hypothetical protein